MSKFKVGDVCVIVRVVHPENAWLVGTDCEVVSVDAECKQGLFYEVMRCDGLKKWHFEDQMRLKRPPSWDSWLYDTRDVEREQRTQVPTQEPSHAQP